MRERRVVLLLGAGAGVVVGAAAAAPLPPTRAVVVHMRVPTPGSYRVTVTLANRSAQRDVVSVRIGSVTWRAVTRGRRHATLAVKLPIAGSELTVRAVGRRSRPHVSISLHRLRDIVPVNPTAPSADGQGSTPAAGSPTSQTSTSTTSSTSTAGSTTSSQSPPPQPAPTGDPGSWKLEFDDEFNGSSLDSSKWSTGWFGSGITGPLGSGALECFDPAQVSAGGGELDVTMAAKPESCGGQTRPYASGIVTTNGKFQFTYGFTEVRAWAPGSDGVIADWPDIWTDGQNWPTDGEDDIMEGLQGHACWHFHYEAGDAPGSCAAGSFTGGWHTFGADWEPGIVTYYYDGSEVGTITQGITSAPMYLLISLGADNTYGGPVAPGTLRIDYARVWQH
jgi:beta-glucanase (GH16 family)